MIFVDSNIPMYLVGAEHPLKREAERAVRRLIQARERFVTDVEVFQELLHRYVAIGRRDAIEPAWQALEGIVDEVFSFAPAQVERAKALVLEVPELSARDAVHAAVMEEQGVERILSFDSGFDRLPEITRIY